MYVQTELCDAQASLANSPQSTFSGHERWLITGASGQLGRYFLINWKKFSSSNDTLLAISRNGGTIAGHQLETLDITDGAALLETLEKYSPTRILHLAGVSRPSEAELNAKVAWAVHVEATKVLAEWASVHCKWMFYASSDFVLAGNGHGLQDEYAPVSTRTVYARSKLEGERVLLETTIGCVGRLSMLWDTTLLCPQQPWGKLVSKLQKGITVNGIVDEWRTPLRFSDAAEIIHALGTASAGGSRGFQGLINIGGSQVTSPYRLICSLRDKIAPKTQVTPVTREHYSPSFPRPENVALNTSRLQNIMANLGLHKPESILLGQ